MHKQTKTIDVSILQWSQYTQEKKWEYLYSDFYLLKKKNCGICGSI